MNVLQNIHRWYTAAVYYLPCRLYYISIPPGVDARYLLEHFDLVMDMYVGYCSARLWNMLVFDVNDSLDATNDEDAASAN